MNTNTKTAQATILIVDDHALFRDGIASMLRGKMNVIGSVSSGEEAINAARESEPDVILMDIMLKGMNGIEATRWIKEQHSQVHVILLSMEIKREFVSGGIQAGISGYLPKDVSGETLVDAINEVMNGNKYFNEAITNLVFEDFYSRAKNASPVKITVSDLSKREEEVLALVAKGLSNREVGEQLFISVKTVETHKAHILDKLGLKNTAELVKYAIKNKLVPL
jgi:DNA-binding NarL/FixJ family response regulator